MYFNWYTIVSKGHQLTPDVTMCCHKVSCVTWASVTWPGLCLLLPLSFVTTLSLVPNSRILSMSSRYNKQQITPLSGWPCSVCAALRKFENSLVSIKNIRCSLSKNTRCSLSKNLIPKNWKNVTAHVMAQAHDVMFRAASLQFTPIHQDLSNSTY